MNNYFRLFLFFLFGLMAGVIQAQGLSFDAGHKPIKDRTSYQVFGENCLPTFTKYFTVDFELSIRNFDSFGYIFSLKNQEEDELYSFTYT